MSTLKLILQFFPMVLSVIKMLEPLFPWSGFGPFKLSMAIAVLGHVYDILSSGTLTKESLFAKLPDLISAVVAEMNKKPESWSDPGNPTPTLPTKPAA